MNNNFKRNLKRIIIVEGKKDEEVCMKIISSNKILNDNDFEIINLKGIDNLKNYLKSVINKLPYIYRRFTEKILIFVDADEDCVKRFNEILECLNNEVFALPDKPGVFSDRIDNRISCAIFVCPDNKSSGSFESLMLKSIDCDHRKLIDSCIDKLFRCVNFLSENLTENNKNKRKFRIFIDLLSEDNFVDTATKLLDFNSEAFLKIRNLIKSMN